jgi:flagellar protein FlaF
LLSPVSSISSEIEDIANLGIFVMKQTLLTQTNPEPRKLDSLTNINRELAAGLRASSAAE